MKFITERDAYKFHVNILINFVLLNLKYLTFCCPLLMVRNDFIWGTLFRPTGGAVLVVQFLTFKSLESIM